MEYWWIWFAIIMLLVFNGSKKKRRRIVANQKILKIRTQKEKEIMRELAQRFIGRDCYINLFEGTADGVIKEVTEGGIVLEKNAAIQAVNLNYVVKIREYPYRNGKRATFVGD